MNGRRKLSSLWVLLILLGFTAPTKPGSYADHCTCHPGTHGTLVAE
jgi:hypothetical protein